MKLFLVISTLSLLQCAPSLETIELAMNLSYGIYEGGEDDFSYLDGKGGEQLINRAEHLGIPKFSLWKSPENILYLIVRGSEDIEDWIVDFDFVEIANDTLGAHFHSGYYFSAVGVWKYVVEEIKKQNLNVIITGHSRGASVGEILHVIGKLDLRNAGLADEVQTIAFAPMPAMSPEGYVLDCVSDVSVFVHRRDVIPILFFKPIAELFYTLCKVFDNKEDTEICKVIENKNLDDFINQFVHINTVVGGNVFWLKYDCDFLGLNCKVKTDLKDSWSSAEELMKFDPDRLSIINGTAFSDHPHAQYSKYLTQVTQFSSYPALEAGKMKLPSELASDEKHAK